MMIGKKEILTLLQQYHIPYEITEHRAVYTMEQLSLVSLPYPEDDAKNLLSGPRFLRRFRTHRHSSQ